MDRNFKKILLHVNERGLILLYFLFIPLKITVHLSDSQQQQDKFVLRLYSSKMC